MCGAINYEYTGEPAVTALCHCVDCQKWTGAGMHLKRVKRASRDLDPLTRISSLHLERRRPSR